MHEKSAMVPAGKQRHILSYVALLVLATDTATQLLPASIERVVLCDCSPALCLPPQSAEVRSRSQKVHNRPTSQPTITNK